MEATSDFKDATWQDGGLLKSIDAELDEQGYMIPKYRVINPGGNERKTMGYMYLIAYGFVEDVLNDHKTQQKPKIRTVAAYPFGVGSSDSSPEDLLKSACALDVSVRRTAGATEKIVMGARGTLGCLAPWSSVLNNGAIFNASKICNNVDLIQLGTPQRLRIFFLSITLLTDKGIYKIPKTVLEFRESNAVAFNLLVSLRIDTDLTRAGMKGIVDKEGRRLATFMLHIGNFVRRGRKPYSIEYCKKKVENMALIFSLGAVGGLSLHVRFTGKLSKRLIASMRFHRNICFSLMDINPGLNKLTWNHECEIQKITAVFQPSIPKDFKIYDDVLIDNTGKILKN
ncbi:matrix protein [Mojiang virus]|uniref:Matrix protein n=1 Tax=Mojiang virus TaxID=1474807 RepID=W8SIW6_9MONO|nr:matrix protein [Mojiang virus]AHM23775.1 matrix protein [Mojiang virus]